jgi:cellulose synthase/poly-beta-1,6-N-acetylglucosamine synthase-like glycosyltransferase
MKPVISLIIPLFNEENHVEKLLKSIFDQNFNKPFELLMIDGMSSDKTINKIKEFDKQNNKKNISIKIFSNKKRRTPYAFNIGLDNFKGDYFAIVGAHSHLDKNWLKYSYETILKSKKNVMGVGGKWINEGDNSISKSIAYTTGTFFGGGISEYRYTNKIKYVDTVVFGLYKKDVVNKIGKFDTNFLCGQDAEFNLRIIKNGYKLLLNSRIKTHYKVRNSISKFIKQMFDYGQARMFIIFKHKNYKLKFFIPLLFVVYLFFIWLSFFSFIFLIPLIFYILLSFYFSIKNPKLFFSNFLIYFLTHFIYGVGELVGIIRYLFGKRIVG